MELLKYIPKLFPLKTKKKILTEKEYALSNEIYKILGQEVDNLALYEEAFSLKSSAKTATGNFERLEFLGDSILGSIISCYLFENYPNANEGFLTQMKSKIVNRKNLNRLGENLNLVHLIQNGNTAALSENISGNLFEALIGAVYLDFDYDSCRRIVLERLLTADEIIKLEKKIISYKSLLLEWSQKKKIALRYETCEEIQAGKTLVFRSHVWLGGERISNATETSKKKAEEKAAQRAFYTLNKNRNLVESEKIPPGL